MTPALRALAQSLSWERPSIIAGTPSGFIPLVVEALAAHSPRAYCIILPEDTDLAPMAQLLGRLTPGLTTLVFPPWDCVPYDRVSPKAALSGTRIKTLSTLHALQASKTQPYVVLTTLEGLLQKVPDAASLNSQSLQLMPGQVCPRTMVHGFCEAQGYRRVDTVFEPGDYAVRGGLIDLFPPDAPDPIRLDFFDTVVESLKTFDAATQRTLSPLKRLVLGSVREVPLHPEALALFRTRFREQFGVQALQEPKIRALLEGRHVAGAEAWLPLFYETMVPFWAYLPATTRWCNLESVIPSPQEIPTFLTEVAENYAQRNAKNPLDALPYRALEPSALYISPAAWAAWCAGIPWCTFISAPQPTDPAQNIYSAGATLNPNFATLFSSPEAHPGKNRYMAVGGYLQEHTPSAMIMASSAGRLQRLVDAVIDATPDLRSYLQKPESTAVIPLSQGFSSPALTIVTDGDVFGASYSAAPLRPTRSPQELMASLSLFEAGDYVVHTHHGIALYHGLTTLTISQATQDFLELEFLDAAKLLVPVEHLELITRYGSGDGTVTLDRLGSPVWASKKAKIRRRLIEIADTLLITAAARLLTTAPQLTVVDGLYTEFCDAFPHVLTPDQAQAEIDVQTDLVQGFPMDRLICGDVGFGKTEIALRAAFMVAAHGHQVVVVVPTTLLCRQHMATFSQRFSSFGLRVAQLSRLVTPVESKKVRTACAEGKVDILIATHAAFGKGMAFSRLGLVIVDEEQHFGVAQKETLKNTYPHVHILTLSATPIPRTLQLSMAGIRPMSLIVTPPVDRQAVRTFIMPYDAMVIREAILREYYRGGQCFYVCPRLKDLPLIAQHLQAMVPDLRIATAHGQMPPVQLEDVMQHFCDGDYDILLSTNIVESGIDIPNANTLIIHRSDLFGLAQLYQLRGRVGRGKTRGYAYLTLSPEKKLSADAQKRLNVMASLDALGAGFSIASHDMDIRGAGNLVGEAQAGHVREIGASLYQQMLKEAVDALKSGTEGESLAESTALPSSSVTLNLGIDALIPATYVEDVHLRLSLYKRLSACRTEADIRALEEEFVDRFGPPPPEVHHMFEALHLKILAQACGIERIDAGPKGATLSFVGATFKDPQKLVAYVIHQKGLVSLRPDHKLLLVQPMVNPNLRYRMIKKVLEDLGHI